ncbi:hypothetical protein EVS84_05535 [Pseudomonas koreensis]|uniref:Uncharacterized protein n=1 Tax=Pseudomonas koreensis TaxID=198620 RepID=A0A4Q4L8H1_9PSED|nr:hypothetical protein EVS84_05535 [Pseudomonas koreensis]
MAAPSSKLWRGDLSPLGREAVLNPRTRWICSTACNGFATATQPSGDKSPRHNLPQVKPGA